MKTIKLNKEEVFEITEQVPCIKSSVAKYGHIESYVFEKDGYNYMIDIDVNDGWQLEDITEAYRVKPIKKTVIEWIRANGEDD